MLIKKVVYFTEPGERSKLDELAEKYKDESSLALEISKHFDKDFYNAMEIAQMWLEVKNKPKKQK